MRIARRRLLQPRPAAKGEPLLPMINVAILLLVLLALGSRLDPADPLPVTLPEAAGQLPEPGAALFLAADGTLALGDLRGAAALAAPGPGVVVLNADRAVPGAMLVEVLRQLAANGHQRVHLLVLPP